MGKAKEKLTFHSCIWPNCSQKTLGWFCRLHFLAKEAIYGLDDTDPKKEWESPATQVQFYTLGIDRLRDFVEYIFDNELI